MRSAAVVVVLAAIWVLLWGSASPANVAHRAARRRCSSSRSCPGSAARSEPLVMRPIAVVRLLGHFLVDLSAPTSC